ncbi:MAG: DNA recombination protein RmuC [Candidatus Omnitrophica bacterium]|nr:DNA recombination protein RmuC [Candidatus Omnitrophota bacterium]
MNEYMVVLCLMVGLLLTALFVAVGVFTRRQGAAVTDATSRIMTDLQREIADLRTSLQTQVLEISRHMNEHLTQSTAVLQKTHQGYTDAVGQVHHRLGELQQATQSMVDIGKDIASLQQILRAPKLRGGLGEMLLAELLKQILPEDHFALQYTFRNKTVVDAVIFLGQGLIPVDSKFPLENFERILKAQDVAGERQAKRDFIQDVKKHIDSIASKYLLPEEGTFEFALMYIPAENVYYETIIKDEMQPESLAAYALRRKVIPVSPNSFYAYLQAIVRGLKGLRIERSAQLILENLGQLETDLKKCLMDFEKIGTHLNSAVSSYSKTSRQLERLQDKLASIEGQHAKPLMTETTSPRE